MRKIVLIAVALVLAISGCATAAQATDTVTVDKENSFLSDFAVEGDIVKITCYITLQNTHAEDRLVELRAYSPEDVAGGLLKEPEMRSSERYSVPANDSAAYEVTFVGVHGGGMQKQNRLLPEIRILIAD